MRELEQILLPESFYKAESERLANIIYKAVYESKVDWWIRNKHIEWRMSLTLENGVTVHYNILKDGTEEINLYYVNIFNEIKTVNISNPQDIYGTLLRILPKILREV